MTQSRLHAGDSRLPEDSAAYGPSGMHEGEEEELQHEEASAGHTHTDGTKQEVARGREKLVTDRYIHTTILEALNRARLEMNMPPFYENTSLVPPAQDYAQYFVDDENDEVSPNPVWFESKIKNQGYEGK